MNFLDFKHKIVCASKYFTSSEIRQIFNLGIHHFGENLVKDFQLKKEAINDLPITWHFIGHLQSNKAKLIINDIDYLHSLDSFNLMKEIQKHRIEPLNVFIQVNLSEENSKSGVLLKDLESFVEETKKYDKINLIGFMTIGVADDPVKTDLVFSQLKQLKEQYQLKYTSMGMSQDYQIALKYQADFIRIGSLFKGVI